MSRYAVFSDIHANLWALNAALAKIDGLPPGEKVDGVWCLGDLVVYGVNPVDVLRVLRDRGILGHCVQGNNDYAISNGLTADSAISQLLSDPKTSGQIRDPNIPPRRAAIITSHNWTWNVLTQAEPELLASLKSLQPTLIREGVWLMHASPCEPNGLEGNYLREAGDAEEAFISQQDTVCFFGHTHLPTAFERVDSERAYDNVVHHTPKDGQRVTLNGNKMLINPGSLGQPRNGDPRAAFAIYDTRGYVDFYRVEYNLAEFEKDLRAKENDIFANVPETEIRYRNQVVNTLAERFQRANW